MENRCELYEDLLAQEALGDIGEKERAFLKAHLSSCASCRSELAVLSDTAGILRREQRAAAPAGLAERTFHRIGATGERLAAAARSYEGTELFRPSTWRVRKSLVGWMVAASILVMAVATLMPGLVGSGNRARIAGCQNNMRLIAVALRQYAADHNDFYPQSANWYKALDWQYLTSQGALMCPARVSVGRRSEAEVDYAYNPERVNIHAGDDYPLLWDRSAAHDSRGRNVLFASGRVAWVEEDEFQVLLARYNIDEAKAHYQ